MNGEQFQRALSKLGLTQQEFADKFSLGLRTVGNWAARGVTNPFAVIVIKQMLKNKRTYARPQRSLSPAD